MKIEDLNFPVRTYNCLKRGKIDTVEQLQRTSDEDLMSIRCFGVGCLKEVHEKLGRESGCKISCGGRCKCQASSAEKQAIFRLGQMDMKECVIAMLEDRKQKLQNLEAMDLILDDVIQMVRGM